MNIETKLPVDNTVFVIASTETAEYRAYCNLKGGYTLTLPDLVNGQTIFVRAAQDRGRVQQERTTEPCAVDCTLAAVYEFKGGKRIRINTDSSKLYRINFGGRIINNHLAFPKLYF